MFSILAELESATAAFVDDDLGLVWVSQADGSIRQVRFSGGSVTVQVAASAPVGIAGNGRVLAFAHQDGSVSVLEAADPGAPLNVVSGRAPPWAKSA